MRSAFDGDSGMTGDDAFSHDPSDTSQVGPTKFNLPLLDSEPLLKAAIGYRFASLVYRGNGDIQTAQFIDTTVML